MNYRQKKKLNKKMSYYRTLKEIHNEMVSFIKKYDYFKDLDSDVMDHLWTLWVLTTLGLKGGKLFNYKELVETDNKSVLDIYNKIKGE